MQCCDKNESVKRSICKTLVFVSWTHLVQTLQETLRKHNSGRPQNVWTVMTTWRMFSPGFTWLIWSQYCRSGSVDSASSRAKPIVTGGICYFLHVILNASMFRKTLLNKSALRRLRVVSLSVMVLDPPVRNLFLFFSLLLHVGASQQGVWCRPSIPSRPDARSGPRAPLLNPQHVMGPREAGATWSPPTGSHGNPEKLGINLYYDQQN